MECLPPFTRRADLWLGCPDLNPIPAGGAGEEASIAMTLPARILEVDPLGVLGRPVLQVLQPVQQLGPELGRVEQDGDQQQPAPNRGCC